MDFNNSMLGQKQSSTSTKPFAQIEGSDMVAMKNELDLRFSKKIKQLDFYYRSLIRDIKPVIFREAIEFVK